MTKKEKDRQKGGGQRAKIDSREMKEGLNGSGHCLQMCQN